MLSRTKHLTKVFVRPLRFNSTSVPKITVPTEGDEAAAESATAVVNVIPSIQDLSVAADHLQDLDGSLVGYLQLRHLVESITNDELFELTKPNGKKFKLYCGADPTAQSLHLGNLLPLMVLLHFRLRGHDVVGLVGGATGAVGDPSGRKTERSAIEDEVRTSNLAKITTQINDFLSNGIKYARSREYPVANGEVEVVNNADWWSDVKLLNFLATYGKYIRVSAMLARDSVQSRLQSKSGIGFNEFTYQILQAYDFWHLFSKKNVNLQVGGNDQWGNITAGVDLISRLQKTKIAENLESKQSFGMTVPLLTTATGEKFGKSAGNAVFIDKNLTTPFQLYQYFVNSPDDIVAKLLKTFTLLPTLVIENKVMAPHLEDPGLRIAQRVLAREVVDLVHGCGYGDEMAYVTGFLFPTPDQPFNDSVSADKLITVLDKSGILSTLDLLKEFKGINDLKMSTLLAHIMGKSKRETKNLIKGGGVYLGLDRTQFEDPEDVVLFDRENHLIENKLMLVRVGKQQFYVVRILGEESL